MRATAAHYLLLRRLRQHLQHRSGFGLIYLFSDHALATQWLHAELDAHLRARGQCLQTLAPASATEPPAQLLQALLASGASARMPFWLSLGALDLPGALGGPWDGYRSQVLARLNENRVVLGRKRVFVFVLLPTHFEGRAADLAPDFWSVRSASYAVPPWQPELRSAQDASPLRSATSPALEAPQVPQQHVAVEVLEQRWNHEWAAWQADRTQILSPAMAWQLVDQWRERQRPDRARALAAQALQISRQMLALAPDSPPTLRDLSISLNKVGDVARDLGQLEEARSAYRESLEIARKLTTRTSDAPQSLRDLSVSLEKVGDVARDLGQWEEAGSVYRESLELRRQLTTLTGNAPQSLRDLSVSLNKLGDVARDLGQVEEARNAYHESLELRRKLTTLTGDAPQSLRDLSFSLDNVGDVARDLGQLEEARSAYRESLEISRQLTSLTGNAPQSLRDLSVSLNKVGDVARDLGQLEEARSAYLEALPLVQSLQLVLASDRTLATAALALERKLQEMGDGA